MIADHLTIELGTEVENARRRIKAVVARRDPQLDQEEAKWRRASESLERYLSGSWQYSETSLSVVIDMFRAVAPTTAAPKKLPVWGEPINKPVDANTEAEAAIKAMQSAIPPTPRF